MIFSKNEILKIDNLITLVLNSFPNRVIKDEIDYYNDIGNYSNDDDLSNVMLYIADEELRYVEIYGNEIKFELHKYHQPLVECLYIDTSQFINLSEEEYFQLSTLLNFFSIPDNTMKKLIKLSLYLRELR